VNRNDTDGSCTTATQTQNFDTLGAFTPDPDVWPIVQHRSVFHPRPVHGCVLCPPTPCKCGWSDGICPTAAECYREWASCETSWRVPA
jgi:hypothetical protein